MFSVLKIGKEQRVRLTLTNVPNSPVFQTLAVRTELHVRTCQEHTAVTVLLATMEYTAGRSQTAAVVALLRYNITTYSSFMVLTCFRSCVVMANV